MIAPTMSRLLAGLLLLPACFNPQLQNGVPCSVDRQCPEGQICAIDDRCYDPDQLPDFDAGIPAECTANETTCEGDVLVSCGPDGIPDSLESCTAGCLEETSSAEAHCAYLSPKYLPDVCDERAINASFEVTSSASIDTDLDANCNGGILTQVDGPDICVFRYGTFSIASEVELKIVGSRAAAIVTDGRLEIAGVLDVSADNFTDGPGGGLLSSGTPTDALGAGGAGFKQMGAEGGSSSDGGGTSGGSPIDPVGLARLLEDRRI